MPHYDLPITLRDEKAYCFDPLRKKPVRFTPEEAVRQRLIRYLLEDVGYPPSLLAVERALQYNGLMKRFDLIGFDRNARPLLLVECKAPEQPLNQAVLEQLSRYNRSYRAPFLAVTNGTDSFAFQFSPNSQDFQPLDALPTFEEMSGSGNK